jgi:hypothetical protein
VQAEAAAVHAVTEITEACGVRWLRSFLSADKQKTYCLYEARNRDDLRDAATRTNIPAAAITVCSAESDPHAFA